MTRPMPGPVPALPTFREKRPGDEVVLKHENSRFGKTCLSKYGCHGVVTASSVKNDSRKIWRLLLQY